MDAWRTRRPLRSMLVAIALVIGITGRLTAQTGIGWSLPGASTVGPPDWVTLGTRLTFYTAGASIANADTQWQEDPNGGWEDPVTGTRYSQTDTPTASGEGYLQVDVIGMDGADVALQWVLYGLDRGNARFFGGNAGGAREPGAAPEEYWIHPQLLAAVPEANLPDLKVLRGEYAVNGTSYHGLGIVNRNPESYSSYIYDLETGLLLSATTRTQGKGSPFHVEGQDPAPGNTQLTIVRIAGLRQRGAAGLDGAIPTWAASQPVLAYAGTWTFVNPYDPTGAPVVNPAQMSVALTPGGPTWMTYRADLLANISGIPYATQGVGVTGGSGPYWMDPGVLAEAREGQPVDQDPITGQRVVVAWVGPGPNGQAVTLSFEMAGLSASATYDVTTGVLLAASRTESSTGITTDLRLQFLP